MLVSGQKQGLSFGWWCKMHKDIVDKASVSTDNTNLPINIIANSAQKPDKEEFFLFGQKHFYYPKDKVKSYLDWTGTHNAKSMYKLHVTKMQEYFHSGKSRKGADEAGRALHYLQDMTEPNHIDSGSVIKKALESINPHHSFEMVFYPQEDGLIGRNVHVKKENLLPIVTIQELQSTTFEDLFDEVVEESSKNPVPKMSNQAEWRDIALNELGLATGATKKFLEILNNNIATDSNPNQ